MTDINYTNKDGIEPAAGYNSYNIRKTDKEDFFDNGNVVEQDELAPSGGGLDPNEFWVYDLYYTLVDDDVESEPALLGSSEYFPNPLVVKKNQIAILDYPTTLPDEYWEYEFDKWVVRSKGNPSEEMDAETAVISYAGDDTEYHHLKERDSNEWMVIAKFKK